MEVLSYLVIIIDLMVSGFLIWRATAKKATLWGAARFIYWYVALLTLYHGVIYVLTLLHPINTDILIHTYLHPFVILYVANPVLIAMIHYRGGHLL